MLNELSLKSGNSGVDNGGVVLSAKQLHSFLSVKKYFFSWIEQKIALYKLSEGNDYVKIEAGRNPNYVGGKDLGGRPEVDYALTTESVMRIVMGANKLDFRAKCNVLEKFFSLKYNNLIESEVGRIREQLSDEILKKDRVIRSLSEILSKNNGVPLVKVSKSYKKQKEYFIIKNIVDDYRIIHGHSSSKRAWEVLYDRFDSRYGLDIRTMASESKLSVIEFIHKIGMLKSLAKVNINSPLAIEYSSRPRFATLKQNDEF